MAKVVAWPGENPGYVNVHTFRRDKKKNPDDPKEKAPVYGKAFRDLGELMNYVQYCSGQLGKHEAIFFCTSTQSQQSMKGKYPSALRSRPNAKWLKAIWLDIDVGKKDSYADVKEAIDAVTAFRAASGLPAPSALVATGGGIHVYWISDKPLTPTDWQPYANGLKDAARDFGLKADLQCTADSARILRMPGTFNTKYGKPRACKVLHLGDEYDFAVEFGHMRAAVAVTGAVTQATPAFTLPAGWKPLAAFSGLTDSLSDGIERYEKLPLDPRSMFKQCQHFRETLRNGGKSDPEPLWMLNLLACTFMEDGRKVAHMLSDRYPSYSSEETDAKYDQRLAYKAERNLGWPSCSNFEGAGAKCQGCPLRGAIRSPLNTCTPTPPTPPAPPPPPVSYDTLPQGYVYNEFGWVCEVLTKRLPGGETSEEIAPLFMSRLRSFEIYTQHGARPEFQCAVNVDMDKWRKAAIGELEMASEQTLMKALRREGIKPYPRNQSRINQFMTTFMSQLDAAQYRTNTVSYGWMMNPQGGQVPIGFAYGGKVFMNDGTEHQASAGDPTFAGMYKPMGDPSSKIWWELLHMVTAQKHPALEALIAASFAAPLIIGTGLYNAILCGWSAGSGAHKTTSVHIGAAVWGEPKRTKEKPNATQKGLMRKAGEIRNLPLYWDEISDPEKMDYVRKMIGEMTEGSLGTRLKQDRTVFAYDEWQTLLSVAANSSLTENILANVKHTDAQLQRLFEFQVEKRDLTPGQAHDIQVATNALDYNYGYIGMQYAKVLGSDPHGILDFVGATTRQFVKEVEGLAPSEARFRTGVGAIIWAGASLANRHLGTSFNLLDLWEFLKKEFVRQADVISKSEIVAGDKLNTANTMTQFLKTMTRNTLWVQSMPVVIGKGRPPAIVIQAGPTKERPDPIHVRCSVGNHVIEISKHKLYEYFKLNKINPAGVLGSLKTHYSAAEYPRIDLSYGSNVGGGRETVIFIPVGPRSPFANILFTHTPPHERHGFVLEEEVIHEKTGPASEGAQTTPENGDGKESPPVGGEVQAQSAQEGATQRTEGAVDSVLEVGGGVQPPVTAAVTASENTPSSEGPTGGSANTSETQT